MLSSSLQRTAPTCILHHTSLSSGPALSRASPMGCVLPACAPSHRALECSSAQFNILNRSMCPIARCSMPSPPHVLPMPSHVLLCQGRVILHDYGGAIPAAVDLDARFSSSVLTWRCLEPISHARRPTDAVSSCGSCAF